MPNFSEISILQNVVMKKSVFAPKLHVIFIVIYSSHDKVHVIYTGHRILGPSFRNKPAHFMYKE